MRVFISYSSRDRADALRLKELAEADGHDVWMDMFDIRPAERLASELEQGVATADVLCVLLSPAAVASPWVREEIGHAIAAEARGLRVLPVILRPAALPDDLADHVAVDATRGLADDAVALRIRRALGGSIDEGILLDALRRGELADRALVDAAEERLPELRARLARVEHDPIRRLTVVVDQDTWPDDRQTVVEIVLTVDIFQGSLSILLAPYVEGRTWREDAGLAERPARDFFAQTKARVDARLLWAGRVVEASTARDGTDLGERPLELAFELPGDEFTGAERATTTALLTRFELPSLRELVDGGSSVAVWTHSRDGRSSERVDPAATDLRLRLEVPLRRDEAGIYGFRLWSHHDRDDRVLLTAPTLADCSTELEREALLSLYRNEPLRAAQNARERRERLAAAVEQQLPVDDVDRWAAFTLAVGRAAVPRLRGHRGEAAQYVHDALALVDGVDPAALGYGNAFELLGAFRHLVDDLRRGGGTPDAIAHYATAAVELARELASLHPDEPDYRRALATALVDRARVGATRAADVEEAIELVEALAREEPFPWREEELRDLRAEAEPLLEPAGS